MFLSTSHNKIDLKSRVSIPASFRLNLEKNNELILVGAMYSLITGEIRILN